MKKKKSDPYAKQIFIAEGIAAVREYIKYSPHLIREIVADAKHRPMVVQALNEYGASQQVKEVGALKQSSKAPVEASIELQLQPEHEFLNSYKSPKHDLILAVDHITDPRNLGALVRTAAFFGVRKILAPDRRQVLLTQASVATAQGGFAKADLVGVTNLVRTLKELKERGYWVLGADMNGEAYEQVVGRYEQQVLVLGNEESGISRLVSEHCDVVISIPGGPDSLESLNVSVAGGILMSSLAPKFLT
jgi:23S rRNA (guanosine2251-2'-O)-methyltransferase